MSKRSRNARAAARSGGRQPSTTRPARTPTPATETTGAPPSHPTDATPPGRPAATSVRPTGARARDRRRPQRQPSRALPLVLGAVAIVVAAAVALLLTQGGDTSARPSPATGSAGASGATVTGAALPVYQEAVQDPAVGQPIPEVSGTSFDGSPISIERDGTPKLLLFLAHWCPHCRDEVPKIQSWVDANGLPDGVDFVTVATSIDPNSPNYPPDAWLQGEGWTPPVIVDGDDRIATAFGLSAFPYWVAVNGDGTVAQRWTGSVDVNRLQALFDGLRATTQSPVPSGSAGSSGEASESAAPSPS